MSFCLPIKHTTKRSQIPSLLLKISAFTDSRCRQQRGETPDFRQLVNKTASSEVVLGGHKLKLAVSTRLATLFVRLPRA